MLIYNFTIKTEWVIQPQWLVWMREVYLPAAMNKDCFLGYQLARLLSVDEEDGPTYVLQLRTETHPEDNDFIAQILEELNKISAEKWGSSILVFNTLMEVVLSK